MKAAAESLVKSFNEHPALTTLMLMLAGALLGYSSYVYAEKNDLNIHIEASNAHFMAIEKQIVSLEIEVRRGNYDQQLKRLEGEIFDLERIIDEGSAREADYDRLRSLESDLRKLERNGP